ncbi:RING finger domain protein, putative [Talaromyces stipitatus ATCC 10500]|uniref:RING finger domain protein, putative n=1 Tax=Talaromyces stipitatus (strain ATCC 10500 / CBS 375.48 / QM 6759 / NRRL 1006) TaxID=441959 RepID=B8LZL5_TALSN|nr:RING finger domain protein, putative [Talaromyces stipitatus ATCC 10500]EED22438.1 RING finger domain protein, putative [Talaromyces stipitatus ATCC 10500]
MATGYAQMIQAWTQGRPASKHERDTQTQGNSNESVKILLGVVLGVAVFFILSMMIALYCHRRNRRMVEDPNCKISLNRLQKLESVAPTRSLEEWWPTVKESLGLSQGLENHFVCVVCFDEVERTQEIHELKCLHVFHKECLEKWYLRSHYTCPMCHRVFFEERDRFISSANMNFAIFT